MTTFLLGALALVGLALGLLLPPLWRQPRAFRSDTQAQVSLSILRAQFAELHDEHAIGHMSAAQLAVAQRELQKRVLDEAGHPNAVAHTAPARATALVLALVLPTLAAAIYLQVGNTAAWSPQEVARSAGDLDDVEQMVARLTERMEASPGDLAGWTLLARSLAALQRFPEASRAFGRAVALEPNDAQLLADHADVLAMVQGHVARGEPERLVARALKMAPDNLKALAVAGSAAQERNDLTTARAHWTKAMALAPPGSSFAMRMASNLDNLNDRGKGELVSLKAPDPTALSVSGLVALGADFSARVAATDTLFVVARGVGPDGVVQRTPVAVDRRSVGAWPVGFTLTDSMAMSPKAKLSDFSNVQLSARVSRSGEAMPQPGDWYATAIVVPVGGGQIKLVIDRELP